MRGAAVNAELAKLDDGRQAHFLDIGPKSLQADGTSARDVMPDFTHLTEKGYRIWAEAMAPEVDRLTKDRP